MSGISTSADCNDQTREGLGVIHRPPFQLRSLPIRYRWEVTRRHPYYQDWWQCARDHHQNAPCEFPQAEQLLRQAAVAILGAIGVSGEPPDPTTEFDEFGEDLNTGWLSGAVHPITFRGMLALAIAALPKETLSHVGMLFLEASCEDKEGCAPRKAESLVKLTTVDKPDLEKVADEPIVSVNPAASGRQVSEAISDLLKRWKDDRQLAERRDRSDRYPDYLRVWDLREGWNNGTYDRSAEKRLIEVASELRMSAKTVHNQYRYAFELIVGHPYSPELWYRVVGPLKLSDLYGPNPGNVSRYRPLVSGSRRDVPESVLGGGSDEGRQGVVAMGAVASDDHDITWLVNDIRRLIAEGLDDHQIKESLGLSSDATSAIAYLRRRGEDVPLDAEK